MCYFTASLVRNISSHQTKGGNMPLVQNGQPTTVQRGDELCIDTHQEHIQLRRKGQFLTQEDGTTDLYTFLPQDGEDLETLAKLVADAVGLTFEEVDDEGGENPDLIVFRFT